MEKYFHAYRIDHVLGFFRIWEVPGDCVTGAKKSDAVLAKKSEGAKKGTLV